jgi:transposase-like protein
MKYTEEIKAQCVEEFKKGTSLTEISKMLGPNPKAIARYVEAAGIALPKKTKKEE